MYFTHNYARNNFLLNVLLFSFDNYTSTVVVDNITVSLGLWDTVSFIYLTINLTSQNLHLRLAKRTMIV